MHNYDLQESDSPSEIKPFTNIESIKNVEKTDCINLSEVFDEIQNCMFDEKINKEILLQIANKSEYIEINLKNQNNQNSLKNYKIKREINELEILFRMYIETVDHKNEITGEIKKINFCFCFYEKLMKSEFWRHRILLIELLSNNFNNFDKKEKNKQKCCTTFFREDYFTNLYKSLIMNKNYEVAVKALKNLNPGNLNMKMFESYSLIENLFKDGMIFPYKIYFFLNFENGKGKSDLFGIRLLFENFYRQNDWKIKILLAREIRKIERWDAKICEKIVDYLISIIKTERSIEIANELIRGLRYNNISNFDRISSIKIIEIILDIFNLFDETFKESCIETLKTLEINSETLEINSETLEKNLEGEEILKDFFKSLGEGTSLYIKFCFISLLKDKHLFLERIDRIDSFSKKENTENNFITKNNNKQIQIGTPLMNSFRNSYENSNISSYRNINNKRLINLKKSDSGDWRIRKKLVKGFYIILKEENTYNYLSTYLKLTFIKLFEDSVYEVRKEMFVHFMRLFCLHGFVFLEVFFEDLIKIDKKEVKIVLWICLNFSNSKNITNSILFNKIEKYLKKLIGEEFLETCYVKKYKNEENKEFIEKMRTIVDFEEFEEFFSEKNLENERHEY